jgi:hypothetical protein
MCKRAFRFVENWKGQNLGCFSCRVAMWSGNENQEGQTQDARILKSPLVSPPASTGLDLRVPSIWRTLRWVMKKALRLGGNAYITKSLNVKFRVQRTAQLAMIHGKLQEIFASCSSSVELVMGSCAEACQIARPLRISEIEI